MEMIRQSFHVPGELPSFEWRDSQAGFSTRYLINWFSILLQCGVTGVNGGKLGSHPCELNVSPGQQQTSDG